jgi:hypothetical protein
MSSTNVPRGRGLFEISRANGERAVTNVRRLAGADRDPGAAFVTAATAGLGLQAAGLLYVSFAAQYGYILSEKPGQRVPSVIEAMMLDTGMIIFSFLALGLAKKGKPSKAERVLIMVCAGLSAAMNYAAADTAAWRSVVVYVLAPVFLAIVTDRVIAGVRRHVLDDEEKSAWSALGRAAAALAKLAGVITLYLLRFVLAPRSTAGGLRRWVLVVTPLQAAELTPAREVRELDAPKDEIREPAELEGATKKARLTWWYEQDPAYGDRGSVAAAASRIAPIIGLAEGTARAYIGRIVDDLEKAGAAS